MTGDQAVEYARVKAACASLGEHFDSVQIFCTKMSDNQSDTKHYIKGCGNWFSRYGQIKAFISDMEKGYILGNDETQENNKKEWE
jgi:hypothetical protein